MVVEPQKTSNELLISITSELLTQEETLTSTYTWLNDRWRYFEDLECMDPETREARNRLFNYTAAYNQSISEFEDCIIQTIHTIDCESDMQVIQACLSRIRETAKRIAYVEGAPGQF